MHIDGGHRLLLIHGQTRPRNTLTREQKNSLEKEQDYYLPPEAEQDKLTEAVSMAPRDR
jgi:hypothetical protein